MAPRGSKKQRSVEHEQFIARAYAGKRSPSSGAADHDQGDVRTEYDLFECKTTGGPEQDAAAQEIGMGPQRSTLLRNFSKLYDEAMSENHMPSVALRIWAPEAPFAEDGWVDLIVRLVRDDAFYRYFGS